MFARLSGLKLVLQGSIPELILSQKCNTVYVHMGPICKGCWFRSSWSVAVHFTRNGVDSVRHTSQEIMMIYTEQSEVNTSKHAVWTNFWTIHVSSASDGKYFCNTKCQSSESKSLYWQCFSLNLSVATLSGSRNSFTDPHITNSQNLLCVKYLIYLCFPGPLLAIYVTWSSEVYSILLCEAV